MLSGLNAGNQVSRFLSQAHGRNASMLSGLNAGNQGRLGHRERRRLVRASMLSGLNAGNQGGLSRDHDLDLASFNAVRLERRKSGWVRAIRSAATAWLQCCPA